MTTPQLCFAAFLCFLALLSLGTPIAYTMLRVSKIIEAPEDGFGAFFVGFFLWMAGLMFTRSLLTAAAKILGFDIGF